jgi:hypothetical protein
MSVVSVDFPTGALLVEGRMVFPIVLSNAPRLGAKTPDGGDALAEIAAGGVSFIRTGRLDWSPKSLDHQIAVEHDRLDAAAAQGLHCWPSLGPAANLAGRTLRAREQLLTSIVGELKDHPALGAWRGVGEPANPARAPRVPPAGLVAAYRKLKSLDSDHPVVIIQAPRGSLASLTPYRPAFDITGADIFPVSYPPGKHAGGRRRGIGAVGEITQKMVSAAGGKPVWMTLQIAWSGAIPAKGHPDNVPRIPTLHEERFMAYQAIVHGARGLVFFGGHLTEIAPPGDAQAGWNWTFWELVLRPLLGELTSPDLAPALVAPAARRTVKATAVDVEVATREAAGFLYVIAVKRGSATSQIGFSGLPSRKNGRPITGGRVLFEYVQEPLAPPIKPDHQTFRPIRATNGRFRDWLGPYDARVYRFRL